VRIQLWICEDRGAGLDVAGLAVALVVVGLAADLKVADLEAELDPRVHHLLMMK
jgi:hypothetical protein